jgi:hypothetical protein
VGKNDHQYAELQGGGEHGPAGGGEVVLVAVADLLDQAVDARALQRATEE